MSWYKEWFDSPLYEKLYASRDEKEAKRLANLIASQSSPEMFPEVLDLGCGRGRHSINLASLGYKVTGIDLSPEAIKKAKSIAKTRELKNVRFELGDMRAKLSEKFSMVVNLFTTFGYFDDDYENELVIQNVSSMLQDDGVFYQDFLNYHKVKEDLVSHETGSVDGISYTIQRSIENGVINKTISFVMQDGSQAEFSEHVKAYTLEWFQNAYSNAGLKITDVYGDYHGNSFSEKKSPRLLLKAVKIAE